MRCCSPLVSTRCEPERRVSLHPSRFSAANTRAALAMSGIVEHCHDEITGIKWLNAVSGYLGLAGRPCRLAERGAGPRAQDKTSVTLVVAVLVDSVTIKSAGFISPKMIGSKNALNFSYALYLRLRADQGMSEGERKRIVRRWFVLTLLTGRSIGSFETVWELDIRRIAQQGASS